jgi:hypothetical protein
MSIIKALTAKQTDPEADELRPELLQFHAWNINFIVSCVAELRWQQKHDWSKSSISAVASHLRWTKTWTRLGDFTINNNLLPLVARVVVHLYPDVRTQLRFAKASADLVVLGGSPSTAESVPVRVRDPTDHARISSEEMAESRTVIHDICWHRLVAAIFERKIAELEAKLAQSLMSQA